MAELVLFALPSSLGEEKKALVKDCISNEEHKIWKTLHTIEIFGLERKTVKNYHFNFWNFSMLAP
jgi:hypothetical protein